MSGAMDAALINLTWWFLLILFTARWWMVFIHMHVTTRSGRSVWTLELISLTVMSVTRYPSAVTKHNRIVLLFRLVFLFHFFHKCFGILTQSCDNYMYFNLTWKNWLDMVETVTWAIHCLIEHQLKMWSIRCSGPEQGQEIIKRAQKLKNHHGFRI